MKSPQEPVTGAAEPPHGTQRHYWRGCRCEYCRLANAMYSRLYYWQHRERGKPVRGNPPHGTDTRYRGRYRCRCSACTTAHAEANRNQRRRTQ